MPLPLSSDWDEVCYPFIQEASVLCDFELITDELCALIGGILAYMPNEFTDIYHDLETLQPLAFHVNGSIRGRLAITEDNIVWLKQRLHHYQDEVSTQIKGFVLPRGTSPIPQLHLARSCAKKAIRALVRIDLEGIEVPLILPRMCNIMCNFFFLLTLVINQRRGCSETYFTSLSYGKVKKAHKE